MKTLLPEILGLAKQCAADQPGMLVELYTVPDQRCIWASDSHEDLLGYDPMELVGVHWRDIVDKADHAHKEIMLNDALLTGDSMQIGFHLIAKSGQRRYVKVIDTLYDDPDSEEKYVLCRSTHVGPMLP
jgi:PAS domain S-box-containing protein